METCLLKGGLSPCRLMLLLCNMSSEANSEYYLWNPVLHRGIQLELPQFRSATCFIWLNGSAWSYNSNLCAFPVRWIRTSEGIIERIRRLLSYTATGRLHQALEVGLCETFKWSPTADILAMVPESGCIKLWDAATDTWSLIPAELDIYLAFIDWSPDGQHVAVAYLTAWTEHSAPNPGPFSCIWSAAGAFCWNGTVYVHKHVGYQSPGLASEVESRWSANGAVCRWMDGQTQPGLLVLSVGGSSSFREVGPIPPACSSVSPCGRILVSVSRSCIPMLPCKSDHEAGNIGCPTLLIP